MQLNRIMHLSVSCESFNTAALGVLLRESDKTILWIYIIYTSLVLCFFFASFSKNARNCRVQVYFSSIMKVLRPGLCRAALLSTVVVIASELNLPRETFVAQDYSVDGFSPLPTSQPVARDIFKRVDPALCGYINGLLDSTISVKWNTFLTVFLSRSFSNVFGWIHLRNKFLISGCRVLPYSFPGIEQMYSRDNLHQLQHPV